MRRKNKLPPLRTCEVRVPYSPSGADAYLLDHWCHWWRMRRHGENSMDFVLCTGVYNVEYADRTPGTVVYVPPIGPYFILNDREGSC